MYIILLVTLSAVVRLRSQSRLRRAGHASVWHQWEDSNWERQGLPLNIAGIVDGSLRPAVKPSSHHFGYDEFSGSVKKKKSGGADPRFKRVVPNILTDEIAAEARKLSESLARSATSKDDNKLTGTELVAYGKSSKIPTFYVKKNKGSENSPTPTSSVGDKAAEREETTGRKQNREDCPDRESSSRKVDKGKGKAEVTQPHPAKKSVSDCTLQTKNTSFGEEDAGDDYTRVQSFTSATRLSKVDNWIREFKPVPEKRRSVITVIGQTQGKSFSAVLNEINQRRKLAKELDKHALCETILAPLEKEKEKELKNLVAKVDFVSADGKVVYSARKIYGFRDSSPFGSVKTGKCEDYTFNKLDSLKLGQMSFKLKDEIPERDVPPNQARKRKTKRLIRKGECRKLDFAGMTRVFLDSVQKQKLVSALVLVSAIFALIIYAFNEKRLLSYVNLGKPKTKSWYENLFR